MIRIWGFAFISLFSLSSFAELKVTANTSLWAVPSETKSCLAWKSGKEQNNIFAKYINLGNLSFEWSDTDKSLRITEIRVSLRDSILKNSAYDCRVTGEELQALGDKNWTEISPASIKRYSLRDTDCPLVCGSIEFAQDIAGTMNGKIEVLGETVDSKSVKESVIFAVPITVDNLEF